MPDQHDAAGVEQRDPVAHALHAVEQMRRQQHGDAVVLSANGSCSSNSCVACGSRPVVGSSRMATLGVLHQDLGKAQALAHAAREGRDPLVGRRRAGRRARARRRCAGRARPRRSPTSARGVAQVVARRELIVEADRVRQIADPALDLERLAHRVVAERLAPARRVTSVKPEQHQDGRRLAGAVGPEQAEDLAGADAEIDAVDGERRAVALGQARSITWPR